jgi:hypothetical protein
MSTRYPGGLITKTPVTPTLSSAPGVWTLEQALAYIKAGTWPYQGAFDSYFNQTTLLLHGDGNQGAANFYNSGSPRYLAFTDNSSNNFPITVNGDAYGTTISPYQGNYSNYFDGSGDYFSIANNAALNLNGVAFTVEFWINRQNSGLTYVTGKSSAYTGNPTGGWNIWLSDGAPFVGYNGDYATIQGSTAIPLNTWAHVALCDDGTTARLFLNGTQIGSSTTRLTTASSTEFVTGQNIVGTTWDQAYSTQGWISNLRVVKGTALYTSNFTPPTAPLTAIANTQLLTCQSNRFVDNSSNNFAITSVGNTSISPFQPFTLAANAYGSGFFDGTGDYLSVPNNAAFQFGTGNFTVEFWVYANGSNNTHGLVAASLTGSGYWASLLFSGLIYWQSQNGTTNLFSASFSGYYDKWTHVAFVRNSGTTRLYLNGVEQVSASDSTNYNGSSGNYDIGRDQDNTAFLNGYISDLRIIKGTAVYTSNFTPPTAPVTNITNTSLLTCQYSGTVNNTGFIDSGPYYFPITKFGNATQGTFSPFSVGAGQWSNYFDGTGDYQTITSGVTNQFDPGSAFTLEGWFYQTSTANCIIFEVRGNTDSFANADGILYRLWTNFNGSSYFQFKSGTAVISILGTTPPNNTWNHLAVGYNGTTTRFWINGVSVGISTSSYTVPTYNRVTIGNNNNQSAPNPFFGYLSNMRFVKGSDVYGVSNTTITVPTTPLTAITNTSLLTCQSNRFVDNSTNNFAITRNGDVKVTPFSPFAPTAAYSINVNGGSGYFDGTGDYLTIANNDALNLSGVFTFECWFYLERTTGIQTIASKWVSGTTAWLCDFSSSTFNFYLAQSGAADSINASWTATTGQWYHIAVTRDSSNNVRMFLNGVQIGSTITSTRTASSTSPVAICFNNSGVSGAGHLQGYVSNFRILKGTAVYTANFTPPTAPFTPVANTSLLLNFTSAGIFDQTGKNNLETLGNAQVDTSVVKYGTGSMKFDGSGDYLLTNGDTNNFAFGSGDFTIEFWVYPTSVSSSVAVIYDSRPASTQGLYPVIYLNNATIKYFVSSADRITGSSLSINTWYHIAITRSGTSTKMFVNGTQSGSTYTDSNSYVNAASRPVIGVSGFNLGLDPFTGYIDDLRITKGVARYTANFTPPTRAFPNQ